MAVVTTRKNKGTSSAVLWFVEHFATTADFIATFSPDEVPPLARQPGFSVWMWLVDFMHSDVMALQSAFKT